MRDWFLPKAINFISCRFDHWLPLLLDKVDCFGTASGASFITEGVMAEMSVTANPYGLLAVRTLSKVGLPEN